jgi:hypothetical protein
MLLRMVLHITLQDIEVAKKRHYCLWHSFRDMYGVATARHEYENVSLLPLRKLGFCS